SSGIWQTVWLEARPRSYIAGFRIIPALEPARVTFQVKATGLTRGGEFLVRAEARYFEGGERFSAAKAAKVQEASTSSEFTLDVPDPKLWTPESPHLYDVTLELRNDQQHSIDSVQTYFGLRTIQHGTFGSEPFERILFNGKPLYLRAALDQSFNPKGLYTAPDDDFMKRDMEIAKNMGLNGLRIHIKPDEPRRLFWADRYGVLILEDMPNTWRQSPSARRAWGQTMRGAVARDSNHPPIIARVALHETLGLRQP